MFAGTRRRSCGSEAVALPTTKINVGYWSNDYKRVAYTKKGAVIRAARPDMRPGRFDCAF
jgi:hypothetical protein